MSFHEFTISDCWNEVMLDVNTKTGKIIDLYTYSDHKLEYYSERLDNLVQLGKGWKSAGNPLFVHCPTNRITDVIKKLASNDDFLVCCGDDDEGEVEIFSKMIRHYELKSYAFGFGE